MPVAILGPSYLQVYPVTLNTLMNLQNKGLAIFYSDKNLIKQDKKYEVMGLPEIPGLYPYLIKQLHMMKNQKKLHAQRAI